MSKSIGSKENSLNNKLAELETNDIFNMGKKFQFR